MSAFSKLFGREKKKEFKAYCELSRQPLAKDAAYFITTAELISSKRFWDNKMTESETMSYSQMHFENKEQGTTMRGFIFDKYSKVDKPWMIGEDQIHQFDIDRDQAAAIANEWLETEGKAVPDVATKSLSNMDDSVFEEIKNYAVMEAGRSRVMA